MIARPGYTHTISDIVLPFLAYGTNLGWVDWIMYLGCSRTRPQSYSPDLAVVSRAGSIYSTTGESRYESCVERYWRKTWFSWVAVQGIPITIIHVDDNSKSWRIWYVT
jgi:hypothetical protein